MLLLISCFSLWHAFLKWVRVKNPLECYFINAWKVFRKRQSCDNTQIE